MRWTNLPLRTRLAMWIARLLPHRVHMAIWLCALDELIDDERDYLQHVEIHEEDGSIELTDAVRYIKIDSLRRRIWRDELGATLTKGGLNA